MLNRSDFSCDDAAAMMHPSLWLPAPSLWRAFNEKPERSRTGNGPPLARSQSQKSSSTAVGVLRRGARPSEMRRASIRSRMASTATMLAALISTSSSHPLGRDASDRNTAVRCGEYATVPNECSI